jgi:AraC-like DNA-binding protein/mannose-6-phosphate isomerase-like protein (cupin superfamily)
MEVYRENKNIGNEFMPLRVYDISIDKYQVTDVKSISGFGKEVEFEICRSCDFTPHYHPYLEIIEIKNGTAQMQINSEHVTLCEGDIALIGSNEIHSLTGCCRHIVINIDHAFIYQVKDFSEEIFPRSITGKLLRKNDTKGELYDFLCKCIDRILTLYAEKPKGYHLLIMSSIYELLGNVYNHTSKFDDHSISSSNKRADLKRLNRIFDYISENYASELSIEDICSVVNLTPSYFCRFFKRNMGSTFFEYLNQYRCSQAEILLHTTEKSITDISNIVGFSSISYFNKVYKKYKGHTPSLDRKKAVV